VAGLAAWSALTNAASIGPRSRVLIMGTGGVSVQALQIAKALGAQVAMISSSDDKLTRVRALGADFTESARQPRWGEAVRRWSGAGVDVALDIGGDTTFDQTLTATRDGGVVAILGLLAHGGGAVNFADVLMRRIRVEGIFVGSRADLVRYLAFVHANALEPVIDRVFGDLLSARKAFAYFTAGRHVGKVVIRVAA
jgi:NADPH:quinone reductase-like Zn-dependent oxidoreductase